MRCADKNRYFSEDEADEVADYEKEIRGINLRSYHCSECGWWHLTKNLSPFSFFKKNKHLPRKKNKKEFFSDLIKKDK